MHHWIVGTPFHYISIGLVLETASLSGVRSVRVLLIAAVCLLLGLRILGAVSLQAAFIRGESSSHYSAELSRLGEFAANQIGKAAFVATEWGVGTQIYCFANGRPNFVDEVFWRYHRPKDLLDIHERSGQRVVYAVDDRRKVVGKAEWILRDYEKSGMWRELPIESELAHFSRIRIRRFMFIGDVSELPPK